MIAKIRLFYSHLLVMIYIRLFGDKLMIIQYEPSVYKTKLNFTKEEYSQCLKG